MAMAPDTIKRAPDRWIFYLLLALIAWVPLPFGSNRPWAWSIMEIWIFLLSIVWLITFIAGKVSFMPVFKKATPVLFLFCLWLVHIAFQVVPLSTDTLSSISPQAAEMYSKLDTVPEKASISVDPYATQTGLVQSVAYVLFFSLCLLLVNRRRRIIQLASVMIFSGLLQALYGSLMHMSGLGYGFFIKHGAVLQQVCGTFINRNHLAAFLVMCLAVGIGMMIAKLATETTDTWKKRFLSFLQLLMGPKFRLRLYLVIMVIALVMTHSRMGNTAFFSSLLIAGAIGLLLSKHAPRSTVILLVSLIVIDVFIVGTWFGIEKVAERIEQTTMQTESRVIAAPHNIDYWQDYKLTGSGLGSFYTVFPQYRQHDVGGFFRHTENDYLEFINETGAIGLGLLGLMIVVTLLIALRAQYKRKDPLMRGVSFAVIMAMSAILIHASVEFNLQIPANVLYFLTILSMAWLSLYLKTEKSKSI